MRQGTRSKEFSLRSSARWLVAGLSTLILIIGNVGMASGSTTHAAPSGSQCAIFKFMGAAGSGELETADQQVRTKMMGKVVKDLYDRIFERYARSHIGEIPIYGVPYPAIPVNLFNRDGPYLDRYNDSVAEGANLLAKEIARSSATCPSQQFIVAGYSQGAQVVNHALNGLAPELLGRVRAKFLFGDPRYNPENSVENVGSGHRTGIFGAGPIDPPDVQKRSRSYCLPTDPICQAVPLVLHGRLSPVALTALAHFAYRQAMTRHAANFLTSIEPPPYCEISTAAWSSQFPNEITNSKGVTITNPPTFGTVRTGPGYRFVDFVAIADQYTGDSSQGTRTVRRDQPAYQISPDHTVSRSGKLYYFLARAVPDKCGIDTSLSFQVHAAETRHVKLSGRLTANRRALANAAIAWQKGPVPSGPVVFHSIDFENLTKADGSWVMELGPHPHPTKPFASPGEVLWSLAFPGNVNYKPSVSPTQRVTVTDTRPITIEEQIVKSRTG